HGPRAAAVLVYARAHVEWSRRDVEGVALGAGAHDHEAALLPWPSFDPVEIFPVELGFAERDRLSDDEIGGDRRFPGAVGCGLLARHGRTRDLTRLMRPRINEPQTPESMAPGR